MLPSINVLARKSGTGNKKLKQYTVSLDFKINDWPTIKKFKFNNFFSYFAICTIILGETLKNKQQNKIRTVLALRFVFLPLLVLQCKSPWFENLFFKQPSSQVKPIAIETQKQICEFNATNDQCQPRLLQRLFPL